MWWIFNGISEYSEWIRNECYKVIVQGLHRLVIKLFKKIKVNSGYKDDIWAANLADME